MRLFLSNIGICTLSFQTLEFVPCRFKHWNAHLILSNIGIRDLSFQTLEFAPYPFKHWISHLILLNIGIRSLCFLYWTWDLILLDIAIRTFFLQRLEFAIYHYKYWNLEHILLNTEIRPSQLRLCHRSFPKLFSSRSLRCWRLFGRAEHQILPSVCLAIPAWTLPRYSYIDLDWLLLIVFSW